MPMNLIRTLTIGVSAVAMLAGAANAQGQGKNKTKPGKADSAVEKIEREADESRGERDVERVTGEDRANQAQERSAEHRRDGEHRQDDEVRPNGQAPQDRAAEHRQNGDHAADGEAVSADARDRAGPLDEGEAVSKGKSAKDMESAKGKGKKRGWWGRLFGRD